MNKTDIDKMFKEKILEHEKSSRVYKPEHWNNFEKQLDKALPVAKKNNFWFTLNNILIVLSVLTSIVLIPILILHSSELNKSSQNPQSTGIADNHIKSAVQTNSTVIESKDNSSQNNANAFYNTKDNEKDQMPVVALMNNSEKQQETPSIKQQENGRQEMAVKPTQTLKKDSAFAAKNDTHITTTVTPKNDTTAENNTRKTNVNNDTVKKTTAGNIPKIQHKKKKSKNIIVQHLNYNGL